MEYVNQAVGSVVGAYAQLQAEAARFVPALQSDLYFAVAFTAAFYVLWSVFAYVTRDKNAPPRFYYFWNMIRGKYNMKKYSLLKMVRLLLRSVCVLCVWEGVHDTQSEYVCDYWGVYSMRIYICASLVSYWGACSIRALSSLLRMYIHFVSGASWLRQTR
jgi:hypothetical protein